MRLDKPEWLAAGTVLIVWLFAVVASNKIEGEASGLATIILAVTGVYLGGVVRTQLRRRMP